MLDAALAELGGNGYESQRTVLALLTARGEIARLARSIVLTYTGDDGARKSMPT